MHYGLTYSQARVLAYQYAQHLPNCSIPEAWELNKIAGKFWMQSFMKRHVTLSLRSPENTSLARATAFNKTTVAEFFNNYIAVMEKYVFPPERIYNLDETGITTVLSTPRVIAETGRKQVGQIVSGERGQLVTFCGIVSATGSTIPPVFVFPRVKYKSYFIHGAPPGSLGLSSKSGWMTGDIFLNVVKHIQHHTGSSKERRILILLDNHESHCTIETIVFCRDNGITLLSFPPHTSHRLQPLDVAVYGPFKAHLKSAFNDWMSSNPGKQITIYDIPGLANKAYLSSFTPKNITIAFEKPGLWPINRLAFSDEDFISCYVTDREESVDGKNTSISQQDNNSENRQEEEQIPNTSTSVLTTAGQVKSPTRRLTSPITARSEIVDSPKSLSLTKLVTPEQIRPFPKAQPRKQTARRMQGKSRVYTTTPEKERIEEITKKRNEKKIKQVSRKVKFDFKEKTRNIRSSSGSSSEMEMSLSDSVNDVSDEELPALCDDAELNIGDFIVVKFLTKKIVVHFVGQILKIYNDREVEAKFLRKKKSENMFVFPNVEDISLVVREDVVYKLPKPIAAGGTLRQKGCFYFPTVPNVVIQ